MEHRFVSFGIMLISSLQGKRINLKINQLNDTSIVHEIHDYLPLAAQELIALNYIKYKHPSQIIHLYSNYAYT